MIFKNKTSYKKGLLAEFLISLYLQIIGYKILEKRFKKKFGEIDLIAKKGSMLVFVEVKNRQNLADGLSSVLRKSQQRIVTTAGIYVQNHPEYAQATLRFDVVVLYSFLKINHIKNAFS